MPLRFVLVAGEHSGDLLGADLIRELKRRHPDAQFAGIAGKHMQAEGCVAWESADSLAVMGIFELIPHLRRLLRIRRELIARVLADPPDVYIGVDYKEFNLSVARKLKAAGLRTVQYVSPQVWAWRQGRVHTIAESLDLMLCLLPFEAPLYEQAGLRAEFVGHPLADQIPLEPDQRGARARLGLQDRPTVAVLPGSRRGEIKRLGDDFAGTVRWLHERRPELQFVAPMANPGARESFASALARCAPGVEVKLLDGESHAALAAADVVLVASGTATLEATLSKRPMVVAYRIHPLTSWLVRSFNLMKAPYFSQPNLLAGRRVVPEIFQENVSPETLGAALLAQLDDAGGRRALVETFTKIHSELRRDASQRAADAILSILNVSLPSRGEGGAA